MNLEKKVEYAVDYLHDHCKVATKIIDFLRSTGISRNVRKKWVYLKFQKEKKNPTKEMIKSKKFFERNKEQIKRNLDCLEDEISRNVYKNIIRFRCTHDVKMFPTYSLDDQYFPKDIISLDKDEVFVDCGAYQGDTYDDLIRFTDNCFKKIICFEPAEDNYDILKLKTRSDSRVCLVKAGVWNENTQLSIDTNEGKTAKVSERVETSSGIKVLVKAIDMIEECSEATFIKMDVEGAELPALEGAINTIKGNRPILAISIYHSDEDLVNIIKWVNDLGMGYKLYVRQHDFVDVDTVLYAV